MYEYFLILISLILSLIIAFLLFFIIFFLQTNGNQLEKISAYECGFHPFEDTRQRFNIRFYLVAILFIIFDLEIIYLFP
jgi:NADH:ubiquinone oxidoreductase subunit 3 (subunit A)